MFLVSALAGKRSQQSLGSVMSRCMSTALEIMNIADPQPLPVHADTSFLIIKPLSSAAYFSDTLFSPPAPTFPKLPVGTSARPIQGLRNHSEIHADATGNYILPNLG